MNHRIRLAVGLLVSLLASTALAVVSADEAKQLGTTLTPWCAEKAGNKEGTIPEYTGERIKIPASFDPKEPGRFPDSWNDKPLFTITAQYPKYVIDNSIKNATSCKAVNNELRLLESHTASMRRCSASSAILTCCGDTPEFILSRSRRFTDKWCSDGRTVRQRSEDGDLS